MPLDTAKVGIVTAELMELLAEEFPEGSVVSTVGVVVEVDIPPDEDAPFGQTSIRYRCSDVRGWVQLGFFDAAKRAVLHTTYGD